MNKQKFLVDFDKINLDDLYKANNNILVVQRNNVDFYFKIFLKQNAKTLLNFSNGARNPQKSTPPFFSRSTWQDDINSHCLYIDDPTLHDSNLRVGWGVGEINHYYLESISTIIKKIINLLNIKSSNTFYFGSSAGGYMSVMLATMHESSIAIANNPQFYVDKQRAINFIKSLYPDISNEDINDKFMYRFSFYDFYKKLSYFPQMVYIVNRLSETDMEKQYKPLIHFLDNNEMYNDNVEIIQYHAANGHSGIFSREKTAELLNGIILNKIGIKNYSRINIIPILTPTFSIRNIMDWEIKDILYSGYLNLPVEYFSKDNYSEIKFKFSSKKGMLYLTLLSEYISSKGQGTLQIEILKNSYIIAKEDMATWNKVNSINIYNLEKNDIISIRVKALKDRSSSSWSQASMLEILSYEEVPMRTIMNKKLTSNSPFMEEL